MTLIAGVFTREGYPVDQSLAETLKAAISRNSADRREVFQHGRLFMVKVDIGTYGEPGVYRDDLAGSVSFLTGEPLLKTSEHCEGQSRSVDLQAIHRDLDSGARNRLRQATGIFSIAHYRPDIGRLTLVTDKIGHRCLYYRIEDRQIVFSSTLRVLEALPLQKTMDVLAAMEMNIYPRHTLNARTPYYDIKRMRPAELLTIDNDAIRSESYFDFGALPQSSATEEYLLHDAHARFMNGVRRRARRDKVVGACLSGGLDSRAVVCALRALGKRVYTSTFYPVNNSQDRVYAEMLSQAAGTIHGEVEVLAWVEGRTFERTMQDTLQKSLRENGESLSRAMLWTGDGGSVSSGHLHIEQDLADLLRAGELKEAFLSYHRGSVDGRLVDKQIVSQMAQLMYESFLDEMNAVACPDRARAFHVFLLKNHQRKDFVQHFETIDLHRLEFEAPFYDSDYLESIVQTPFDLTIAHRFYQKWLRLFPSYTTAVPWQTYAGHEPCPLPQRPGVLPQWDPTVLAAVNQAKRKATLKEAANVLRGDSFPAPLINKNLFRLAFYLHRLGYRDCETALKMALGFCEYWNKAGGRFIVPESLVQAEACMPARLASSPEPVLSTASAPA